MLLSLFRKRAIQFFSEEEQQTIVSAIKQAERNTSGEVRVYIESHCEYIDALRRATELFGKLEMYKTDQRNAVLIYVALKDRQLAIFGDEGIHNKVGSAFWNNEVKQMIEAFKQNNYAQGIAEIALHVGNALQHHFPYQKDTDVNELPDDIVFGK